MTGIVTDPIFGKHLTGKFHPESPLRNQSIMSALQKCRLIEPKNLIKPRLPLKEELLLCHSDQYLQILEENIERCRHLKIEDGSFTLSTGDVQICPKSFEVALYAVGGVLEAVDRVMDGSFQNAFCAVRPPGHHATKNQGMGFCLLNNVAIGARYLQKKYGLKKILVVDWDVHHGNGTQDIFDDDPSVFYFSTHQSPLYPGTGRVEERGIGFARGTKLNCPILASPQSRIEVVRAFEEKLLPALVTFSPDFVLISAGFDAHEFDPLGGFNLIDQDFIYLTELIKGIAEKFCSCRLVSVLEGGYHLEALASAVTAHIKTLNS